MREMTRRRRPAEARPVLPPGLNGRPLEDAQVKEWFLYLYQTVEEIRSQQDRILTTLERIEASQEQSDQRWDAIRRWTWRAGGALIATLAALAMTLLVVLLRLLAASPERLSLLL